MRMRHTVAVSEVSASIILGKIDAFQVSVLNLGFPAVAIRDVATATASSPSSPSSASASGAAPTRTSSLSGAIAVLHPAGAESRDGRVVGGIDWEGERRVAARQDRGHRLPVGFQLFGQVDIVRRLQLGPELSELLRVENKDANMSVLEENQTCVLSLYL